MISEEQINDLIESNEDYAKAYFIWQMDEENTNLEQFYIDEIELDLDDKVIALMQHTGAYYSDAERAMDNSDWYVLTDNEADQRCREYAEDVIETVLYDIDKSLHYYFDKDRCIEDYIESGRGSILSGYKGDEYEETVNGTTYYLYRQ